VQGVYELAEVSGSRQINLTSTIFAGGVDVDVREEAPYMPLAQVGFVRSAEEIRALFKYVSKELSWEGMKLNQIDLDKTFTLLETSASPDEAPEDAAAEPNST